jgi:hypothetical protein
LSQFQNPVGFGLAPGKSGLKSAFSSKSREAVPKSDILEQPQFKKFFAVWVYSSSPFPVLEGREGDYAIQVSIRYRLEDEAP